MSDDGKSSNEQGSEIESIEMGGLMINIDDIDQQLASENSYKFISDAVAALLHGEGNGIPSGMVLLRREDVVSMMAEVKDARAKVAENIPSSSSDMLQLLNECRGASDVAKLNKVPGVSVYMCDADDVHTFASSFPSPEYTVGAHSIDFVSPFDGLKKQLLTHSGSRASIGAKVLRRQADLTKCESELLSLCEVRLAIIRDIVGLEIDAEVCSRYEIGLQNEQAGKQAMVVTLKEQKARIARIARKMLKESERKLKAALSGNKRSIEHVSDSDSDDDDAAARKKARKTITARLLPPAAAAASSSAAAAASSSNLPD